MGMKIGSDLVKEKNKPKNTKISRIPEGIEDAHFKSFFNGFYDAGKQDFGDKSTCANQDVSKIAT